VTEQEFIDAQDFNYVNAALAFLEKGNFNEMPDKQRYLSVIENLKLIRSSLMSKVEIVDN